MLTPVDSAGGIRKGGSSEVDESLADDTNTPKIEFCLRIIRGTQNGPQRKFHGTICFFFALVLDTQKKESRDASKTMVTRCHQWISGSQPKNLRIFGSRELGKNRSEELKN